MDDKMFDELCTGVEQAIAHASGERDLEEDQIRFHDEPDPREIRSTLGMTQEEFATLLDVSVATLRNWEQGRRKPRGPAETLLRVAEEKPDALLEVLDQLRDQSEPAPGPRYLASVWHAARPGQRPMKGLRLSGQKQLHKHKEASSHVSAKRNVEPERSADDYSYAMAV